ncbi:MAG: hypothetical protein JSS11_09040 [Verrucomicrobia bacterium]|nr:hypothetical protein [Verrucomicrobiota bacterium]
MKVHHANSRTVSLGSKFSQSEADNIRHAARISGTTVSSMIHDVAVKGEVHPRPYIDPIAIEQWRALAPLAANLNQLTRSINQGRIADTADVLDGIIQLQGTLTEIRNALIGEERMAA